MAESNIVCSLPRFKERVMYIANENENLSQSYTISSSFKGILRLSPNNNNSIYEKITSQIGLISENNLEISYTDAIAFGDDATSNTLASIDRRMIIGSDSDGYLVDFRISRDALEFDTLYVVGIAKTNYLTIFCNDTSDFKKGFVLGNTYMQTTPNKSIDVATTEVKSSKFDMRDINIKKEGGDLSYMLSGEMYNNKRAFRYQRTQTFIKELVMEALMDLQTIPTGSIHFVPVSLEQYLLLLEGGKKYPNMQLKDNQSVDPIIMDFLLCDGRRYYNQDFPELAKILWEEKIDYWKTDKIDGTKKISHRITGYTNTYKKTWNDEEESSPQPESDIYKTFRVPDLRRMFISSMMATGVHNYKGIGMKIEDYSKFNYPGHWLPDNLPLSKHYENDKHFHFIAYGSYSPTVSFPRGEKTEDGYGKTTQASYNELKGYNTRFRTVANAISGSMTTSRPKSSNQRNAVLSLTNFPAYSQIERNGPGFGEYFKHMKNTKRYWGYEPYPGIAYLSGPRTPNDTKIATFEQPSIGRTTTAFSIVESTNVTSNDMVYYTTNNILKNDKYVELNKNTYCKENTPKYFACLPLIKI